MEPETGAALGARAGLRRRAGARPRALQVVPVGRKPTRADAPWVMIPLHLRPRPPREGSARATAARGLASSTAAIVRYTFVEGVIPGQRVRAVAVRDDGKWISAVVGSGRGAAQIAGLVRPVIDGTVGEGIDDAPNLAGLAEGRHREEKDRDHGRFEREFVTNHRFLYSLNL